MNAQHTFSTRKNSEPPDIKEIAMDRQPLRIAVIGLGWMGQAHSRSYARIPQLFEDREYDPVLAICADNMEQRRDQAVHSFGFEEAVADWREVMDRDDIDVVTCTARP